MHSWYRAVAVILPVLTATPVSALPLECSNWQNLHPQWLWCDDFESDSQLDIDYFEVDRAGGRFGVSTDSAYGGNAALKGIFIPSSRDAGNLKFSFGRTPVEPARFLNQDFQEVYWRFFMKTDANWSGNPAKTARITIFSAPDWSQAMIGHLWENSTDGLALDPASGVAADLASNQVITTGYNDFNQLRWLGILNGSTPVYSAAYRDTWVCVETHVRLNTPGQSDGLFEFWIDDMAQAGNQNLNWRSSYQDYGLNALFLENYSKGNLAQTQSRYFDNLVISSARIGCNTTPVIATRCDLNGNGHVDAGDLAQVLGMIAGHIAMDADCDVDYGGAGNGSITASDFLLLSRTALGS